MPGDPPPDPDPPPKIDEYFVCQVQDTRPPVCVQTIDGWWRVADRATLTIDERARELCLVGVARDGYLIAEERRWTIVAGAGAVVAIEVAGSPSR